MSDSMPVRAVLENVYSRLGTVDEGYKAMGEHVHSCDQRSLRRRLEVEQLRKDHEDHKVRIKEDGGKSKITAMLLPALPGIVAAAIGWGALQTTVASLKEVQDEQKSVLKEEVKELQQLISDIRSGGK